MKLDDFYHLEYSHPAKCYENDNKDEDNSLNTLNDETI